MRTTTASSTSPSSARSCATARRASSRDEELSERFDALDEDGSGKIDMAEYLLWSLKDALARSAQRVVDLFRAWDEDRAARWTRRSSTRRCARLGFDVEREDTDAVFDSLDDDNSGALEYKELAMMLRKGAGSEAAQGEPEADGGKQADRPRRQDDGART